MVEDGDPTLEGGCTCGAVRYRMTSRPMFVHCCHCRWCQRETGASFALNAMIEADRVIHVRIPMKAASDSDGKAATHSDQKRPLFQRSELAGVIVAVG